MKISLFVQSLPSLLSRETVAERATEVLERLTSTCIPLYNTTLAVLGYKKFTSPLGHELEAVWNNRTGGQVLLGDVAQTLGKTVEMLNMVLAELPKLMQVNEPSSSLSLTKTTVLQLVLAADLIAQYSVTMLDVLLAEQTGNEVKIKHGTYNKQVLEQVMTGYPDFVTCCKAMHYGSDRLRKALHSSALATVIARDIELQDLAALGLSGDDIDPLSQANLSVKWNPFYHVFGAITRWRKYRLESLQDRVLLINARIKYLESYRDTGQASARMETEIKRLTDEVETQTFKLTKMEDELSEEVPII